ncbi:MAG: hypothetical protein VX913_03785 [Planctomycetota bacterium]|nr:hypothetical protein [Planctomycetota bacterium]
MQRMHNSRLSPALTFLAILCLVAACSDDPSDGGGGSGPRTASHLHGTWVMDIDRMRDAAEPGRELTEEDLNELESLTLSFSEGSMKTSQGKEGEWKIASTDGDTWELEAKRDGKDKWKRLRIEWIDDDHVKMQEKADVVLYLQRQK